MYMGRPGGRAAGPYTFIYVCIIYIICTNITKMCFGKCHISINRLARNCNWIWIVTPRLVLDYFRTVLSSWKRCRKHTPNPSRTY